jgi:hypothetical protein
MNSDFMDCSNDSKGKFFVAGSIEEGAAAGRTRHCHWAARKNTTQKCAIEVVAWQCPVTCNVPCNSNSTLLAENQDKSFDKDLSTARTRGNEITEKNNGEKKGVDPVLRAVIGVISFHGTIAIVAIIVNWFLKSKKAQKKVAKSTEEKSSALSSS